MPFLTKLSGQYRMTENSYRSFAAINFESNTPFYGAVYLPKADIVFSSNIDFHGSAIGKSMVLNSNVDLTYAQELQDLEGLPEWNSLFVVKSWQEKRPL